MNEIRDTTGNILRPGMYGYEERQNMKTQPNQTSEGNAPRVNTAAELDYVLAQRKQLAEVTAQRDELLAALKETNRCLIWHCEQHGYVAMDRKAVEDAEAAIAKAEQH